MKNSIQIPDLLLEEQNFYTHPSNNFHIAVHQHNQENKAAKIQLNKHLFTFLIHGQKEINHYSQSHVLKEGELILFKRGTYLLSELILNESSGYKAILFFFDRVPNLSVPLKSEPSVQEVSYLFNVGKHAILRDYFTLMQEYIGFYDKAGFENILELKFRELLSLVLKLNPQILPYLAVLSHTGKAKILDTLESNYRQDLSVEQIAYLTGMSVANFKKKIKSELGTTTQKWIFEKRLQEAYQLITSSDSNINEIAYNIGFKNPSHFNKLFKQKFKSTPLQIRNQVARL